MTLRLGDRIKETSVSYSTASFTLAGAVPGFTRFFDWLDESDQTWYCATDESGNWEVGFGWLMSPTVLDRSIVSSSSAGELKATFSGTVTVFCSIPADKLVVPYGMFYLSLANQAVAGDAEADVLLNDYVASEHISLGEDGEVNLLRGGQYQVSWSVKSIGVGLTSSRYDLYAGGGLVAEGVPGPEVAGASVSHGAALVWMPPGGGPLKLHGVTHGTSGLEIVQGEAATRLHVHRFRPGDQPD